MKRIARPDLTAAEAFRLGEELREARMALGVSVADMAEQIRIRRVYLQALEEGRLQDLPGRAYVVGFLRNYSAALGLDTDEVLRRFREVSEPGPRANLIFPEPVPNRGVPAGAVMLAGAVLAVGAYVFWYNWSSGGPRIVDGVPPLPPRLEQAADEIAPRPTPAPSGQVATVAPAPDAPAAAVTRGLTPPGSLPPATAPGGSAATPAPQPASPAAPVSPPAAAAPQPAAPPPGDGSRIMLRGRGEAWIQLRDTRANRVLVDRVLRAGETFAVPAQEGLTLTTGRADAMELLVDGAVVPALQGVTGVRRDIPMDPDRLRAGPLPAPPRPAPRRQPAPPPTDQPPAQAPQ
ncbi:MAG TPA: RodZ domain-containing protein [Roseomonas sp.]|jgi:cytoskeleton protein RodZ